MAKGSSFSHNFITYWAKFPNSFTSTPSSKV